MKKWLKIALIIVIILVVLTGLFVLINFVSNKIINTPVVSITLKYYEGYNIGSGDAISSTIPVNKIKLKGSDLKEVKKLVKSLEKYEFPKDDIYMNQIHMVDNYELLINGCHKLYIGSEYGLDPLYKKDFKVPKELLNVINELTNNYSETNLYKKINSNKITIISENEKLEVTDQNVLNTISNYSYYIINANDKEFEGEKIAYTLDLNDGRKIQIQYASVLSCIYYADGKHDYIYTGDLEDYIDIVFKNNKIKFAQNVTKITATYHNKEYTVDDINEVNDLLVQFKGLKYNDYSYLESMNESEFDDTYIIIKVGNSKYAIPESKNIGNRYYVDEDGKIYDVSDMNIVEKYFKNLVGYVDTY